MSSRIVRLFRLEATDSTGGVAIVALNQPVMKPEVLQETEVEIYLLYKFQFRGFDELRLLVFQRKQLLQGRF